MSAPAMAEREMSLTEAAAYLGVGIDTMRKRIKQEGIPIRYEGNRIRILQSDLDAYKARKRGKHPRNQQE